MRELTRFRVAGLGFSISGDDAERARETLDAWTRLEAGPAESLVAYELELLPERKRLRRDGQTYYASESAQDVLYALELEVYREVREGPHATPLHAAGVRLGEEAVVLVGASGAGKSTLSLALLERGAGYLGDEHVFVWDDLRVSGMPRAIYLRDDESAHVPPAEQVAGGRYPIAHVVVLQTPRAAQGTPRRVSSGEAAAQLLAGLHRPARQIDLTRLASLAAKAPVWTLACDGVDAACDAVQGLKG